MRNKTLLISLSVFIILVVGAIIYSTQRGKRLPSDRPFTELDTKLLERIEIKKKDQTCILRKEDNIWMITDPLSYKADPDGVNNILKELKDFELGQVVSANKEKHAKFEVDEKRGVRFSAYKKNQEEPELNFFVGKMAFDHLHYYFRFAEEEKVYASKGLKRYMFDKQVRDWRDKTIVSLPKDKIQEVDLIYPKETVKLLRKATAWVLNDLEQGKEADSSKVETVLNTISDFRTDDFVGVEEEQNLKKFGLEKPKFSVMAKTDVEEARVYIGSKKGENQYYVKLDILPTVFLVGSYRIDNLKKKLPDLEKK